MYTVLTGAQRRALSLPAVDSVAAGLPGSNFMHRWLFSWSLAGVSSSGIAKRWLYFSAEP